MEAAQFQASTSRLDELLSLGVITQQDFDLRKKALVDAYVAGVPGVPPSAGAVGPVRTHRRPYAPRAAPYVPRPFIVPRRVATNALVTQSFRRPGFVPRGLMVAPAVNMRGMAPTRAPQVRTCHNCGAFDHAVAECPQPEMCHTCKQPGHKMVQCPMRGAGVQQVTAGGKRIRCHNCQATDHLAYECPNPEVCHNCKATDHKVSQCPLPQKCHRCGGTDHQFKYCPTWNT
eukprot:TRINITY_DN5245_c0_g1_i1.p1 TRINITY_DN5245_c0_g1~~TRINITY_DN5245_c0_g1_i1.p1  ORF type:complete len:230 (+),score=6.22 TRINITY_DN5245_c0_g1_i1:50-739(+)